MEQSPIRSLITKLLCLSFVLPGLTPLTLEARQFGGNNRVAPVLATLADKQQTDQTTRAPREPVTPDQPVVGQQSLVPVFGSLNIPQDLNVGGTTTVDNLVVNGTITAPGGFNIGDLLVLTDGGTGTACIVFRQPDLFEKGRICSSNIPNTPGIRMSVDGGVTQNLQIKNGGTVEIAKDLQVDQTAYPHDLQVTDSAAVGGLSSLQATNIFGHLHATQTKYFDRGTPGVAKHVLLVTQGDLTGPDTFNSIKAAVDSITDASETNPYAVVVGAGIFHEDTITLKPFISLIGQSPEATIIEVNDPNTDVIIGCDESFVTNLKMTGATGVGCAGARFTTGGKFELNQIEFGSNNICLYEDATGGDAHVIWANCIIEADAEFEIGIRLVGTGGNTAVMKLSNLTWLADTNTIFSRVLDISGSNANFVGSGIDLGSPTLLFGGTGCQITDGATLTLQSCSFHGFSTGILVPASGAGPSVSLSGVTGRGNTTDIDIAHPGAAGTINGVFEQSKVVINSATTISLFIIDPVAQGTATMGPIYMGDTFATITDMSPIFEQGLPLGVIQGGLLTAGAGLSLNVAGGSGYLVTSAGHLLYITWLPAVITLDDNADNFIFVDQNGLVQKSGGAPDYYQVIELGKARTEGGAILFVQEQARQAERAVTDIDSLLRNALGPIYQFGSLTSKDGFLGLVVNAGEYYFGTHEYTPSGKLAATNWNAWCHNGPGTYNVTSTNQVDYQNYDNGTALTPLALGTCARHAFYVVGDGATERYELVYGQVQYADRAAALAGVLPPAPATWTGNIALIASIVVENTGAPSALSIRDILDERPRVGFSASSVAGVVTAHDDLSGRALDANHPQYLLISGTRTMTGNLAMGSNQITGAGQINGVTIQAHASRHQPISGADPLATATPVAIGLTNAQGVSDFFVHSDHVHAHGNLLNNTLASHAVATTALAGFMSAADKTKLDGINTGDFVLKTGDTMTGSLILSGGSTNLTVGGTLGVTGAVTLSNLPLGVVHASGAGLLSSSQIVDSDINPLSSTYIGAALANSATNLNTASQIVRRDGSGNFSAGTITASLNGNAVTATTATNFTGVLAGDVSGTQSATIVESVGGQTAAQVAAGTVLATSSTSTNTANQIVRRDGSGNFSAGTITASLNGNAVTATTATNFTGVLAGDVTGTQGATVVGLVGGQTAAQVAAGVVLANNATNLNTVSQIVKRDAGGNFSAGNITANLLGNATSATTAVTSTNFLGSLAGDVTGTQGATVVSLVGGQSAAQVAAGTVLANNATNLNTASQIVRRDASGNFLAGMITANLTGTVTGSSSLNVLKTGDTMSGPLTLNGALNVNSGYTFAQGVPAIGGQQLQVIKGTVRGPNQFNSIKVAVDSITDASITKPYTVNVGPGVFVEDTITLQPYVSLIGQSPEATIIEVDNPNKDVIVGCDESCVAGVKITGATGAGKAGVRFTTGGKFELNQIEFGSNNTCLYESAVGGNAIMIWGNCVIEADAEFVTGVKIDGSGANLAAMKLNNLTWLAESNSVFSRVFDITGANANFVGSGIDLGSPTFFGGTGCQVTDGAALTLQSSSFHGFATGILVPASGAGPSISLSSVTGRGNTTDVAVAHPGATGTINGVFERSKVVVSPTTVISLFITDPVMQGTATMGPIYMGDTFATITDMSPIFEQGLPLGVIQGGLLTAGAGLSLNVAGGSGYLVTGAGHLLYITWSPAALTLANNTDNFIYVDQTGTIFASGSEPDPLTQIELGKARTDSGTITFIQDQSRQATRAVTDIDSLLRNGVGPIYESGSLVSKSGNLNLVVSSGEYYFGTHEYFPSGKLAATNWSAWCHNGPGTYSVTSTNLVDYQNYDNGTALTPIPSLGQCVRHAFYVVGDGPTERYELVYGQVLYASPALALAGVLPPPPGTWTGNIALIASIIVENTAVAGPTSIATIVDERPQIGFKASGVAGVITQHDDLSGRSLDGNHPQYLLINGTRLMTGDLQLGTNNITGVGTVNGVTVESHAARHLPISGADPLATATPVAIGLVNALGGSDFFVHSDHVHAHGDLPGGSLHDLAIANPGGVAGFMSAADKTLLDSINPSLYVQNTGSQSMTGPLAITDTGTNSLNIGSGKFVVAGLTGNTTIGGTLGVTGAVTLSNLGLGVVHSSGAGLLSSSLIVNADFDPLSTVYLGALLGYNATNLNTASQIVRRDGSGNFSAGNITANLLGNATTATTATSATSFTGPLVGDVTGTQGATVVNLVGGQSAANVAAGTVLANNSTSANTANQIVRRDGSGNFSAGNITANLLGNATTATSATSFTGALLGDVTGTQGATVVALVGGQTAANVAAGTVLANNSTSANTASQIVRRDVLGNFSAGNITANLLGNATTATSATNFTGALLGDVTGTQGATIVSLVGGQTAANVAAGTVLANNSTSANTANQIVRRDASGNFSAGMITANLTGAVTGAASANVLKAGDTMTGALLMGNQNQVRLGDTGVNYVAMRAPTTLPSSYTLTYPATAGAAGQVLSTDGAGTLNWIANGSGGSSAYYVSAYAGAARTLPSNTTETVRFNTEVLDSNNNFDPVTFTYTAPVTGIYWVGVNLAATSAASFTRRLQVVRNGLAVTGASQLWSTANNPNALVALVSLNAGDLLRIDYSGRSADVIQANDTSLFIYKI